MKFTLLYILPILLAVEAAPINDAIIEHTTITRDAPHSIHDLEKQLNVVFYVQNFKSVMTNYVKSQHKDLSVKELEQVEKTIENFLHNFAQKLKKVMEEDEQAEEYSEKINDGLPVSTFNEVKQSVLSDFPHIGEDKADRIVRALRQNLYRTRQQLDRIIIDSHNAAIANS